MKDGSLTRCSISAIEGAATLENVWLRGVPTRDWRRGDPTRDTAELPPFSEKSYEGDSMGGCVKTDGVCTERLEF